MAKLQPLPFYMQYNAILTLHSLGIACKNYTQLQSAQTQDLCNFASSDALSIENQADAVKSDLPKSIQCKKLPERQVFCLERQHTLRGLFKLFMSFFCIFASFLLVTTFKPYPLSNIHPSCVLHIETLRYWKYNAIQLCLVDGVSKRGDILWAFLFRKRGDMCCTICQNSIPNSFTTLPISMSAPQTILNALCLASRRLRMENNPIGIHSFDWLCIGTQIQM